MCALKLNKRLTQRSATAVLVALLLLVAASARILCCWYEASGLLCAVHVHIDCCRHRRAAHDARDAASTLLHETKLCNLQCKCFQNLAVCASSQQRGPASSRHTRGSVEPRRLYGASGQLRSSGSLGLPLSLTSMTSQLSSPAPLLKTLFQLRALVTYKAPSMPRKTSEVGAQDNVSLSPYDAPNACRLRSFYIQRTVHS